MTAIQIFGDKPFDMNPARFEALAGHQKGELVRLMVERCYGKAALVKILGQPLDRIVKLYREPTAFKTGAVEGATGGNGSLAGQAKTGPQPRGRVSATGLRILALIGARGGQISLGYDALAMEAVMSNKAATVACGRLLDMDLIQRTATDNRGRITWRLTDKGQAVLEELEALAGGRADA